MNDKEQLNFDEWYEKLMNGPITKRDQLDAETNIILSEQENDDS